MKRFFRTSILVYGLIAISATSSCFASYAKSSQESLAYSPRRLIRGTAKKPNFPKAFIDLLHYFQIPCNTDDIDSVHAALESRWTRGKKEIWELPDLELSDKGYVWSLLQEIGVIDEVQPKKQTYEYGVVLGAVCGLMKKRLTVLNNHFKNGVRFNQILLKASERPLDPVVEDEAAIVRQLADTPKLSIPAGAVLPKTEGEALLFYFEHMELEPELKKLPVMVISAQMHEKAEGSTRPNTIDSLNKWLQTSPKPGTTLLVSSQPYVPYQGSVYRKLLPDAFEIDCVGDVCHPKFQMMKILGAVYAWYRIEYEAVKEGKPLR